MAAAVRHGKEVIVVVGRRHRDDVRIGGRPQRRRFRAGIAGRRDQHDALLLRRRERAAERRIGRTGEAHVDDAGALRRPPSRSTR